MKILIAGDFCAKGRVYQQLINHNYEYLLGSVKPILAGADYSIVNLECPIVEHDAQPIPKCGPNLKGPREMVDALQWVGFDCYTLANNHIMDYGETGMLDTLMYLNEKCADYVGGGNSIGQASETLYKEIKGKTLAVINCCEHEFSIATENSSGANPLNPTQQYYKIQEARKKANYVLVIVHGGHEHYQLPSPRMKETYRFFVDAGADAVVNHHQHCYSGYEIYKEKPIFYGIGNFLFDWEGQRNSIWNQGYLTMIEFGNRVTFSIIPYIQGGKECGVCVLKNENALIRFKESLEQLNKEILHDKRLKFLYEQRMDNIAQDYLMTIEPYWGRLMVGLYVRGLLPSFLTKTRILRLIDYVNCDAHLDGMRCMLNKMLSKKG